MLVNEVQLPISHVSNLLVMVAKQFLFRSKCLGKKPSIREFEYEINFIQKTEMFHVITKGRQAVCRMVIFKYRWK